MIEFHISIAWFAIIILNLHEYAEKENGTFTEVGNKRAKIFCKTLMFGLVIIEYLIIKKVI